MKSILKTSLIIFFGILLAAAGIYYFKGNKTYEVSKSDTTDELKLPLSAGELIPCRKFLTSVRGSEAIKINYTADLLLRVFYMPDEFKIKEGLDIGLHASFPEKWNYRIFYSDGFRSEDITDFVKDPSGSPPDILENSWGVELINKIRETELRDQLVPGKAVYQKLAEVLKGGGLQVEPHISGIQFNPSGPREFNNQNEAIWSTFLNEAATYRGFFEPTGSIQFSMPDKELPFGVISRDFQVAVPPETELMVEIDVKEVWWKSLYGIIIALSGVFIASFPAWWPLIKEFRQKRNK